MGWARPPRGFPGPEATFLPGHLRRREGWKGLRVRVHVAMP